MVNTMKDDVRRVGLAVDRVVVCVSRQAGVGGSNRHYLNMFMQSRAGGEPPEIWQNGLAQFFCSAGSKMGPALAKQVDLRQ